MANNLYTTKTAALKATRADVRDLNTKKLSLNGKNILDYISDSEFNSYDARDPQLKNDELDIWNTEISLSEEGHIEVKPFEHKIETISSTQSTTIQSAVKVIDNEVLGANDEHLMYWQTNGLTSATNLLVNCENLTTFNSDLSSLRDGYGMFSFCSNLTSFTSDLPSLADGSYMFERCSNLTTFSSDSSGSPVNLSSLRTGKGMFNECTNLTSFSSDLPSLEDGEKMFEYCTNLKTFSSDLSSLTGCKYMFQNCANLTTFNADLSSQRTGNYMFQGCVNLTTFTSNLSSLRAGTKMFFNCKLDGPSVANIIHTLSTYDGTIDIGIGCNNTAEDLLLFAQECDCETWQELVGDFSAKNWTVRFQCNGRPTTTYNMRRGETLPIYTKLEEVTEGEHYAYTSADGSKFYNIDYFHSTNGSTEGYDVFSSLEEAISTYNVTPKN